MADDILCIGKINKGERILVINPDYKIVHEKNGDSEKNYETGEKK